MVMQAKDGKKFPDRCCKHTFYGANKFSTHKVSNVH